jgi:EF-P beta-lysylation protein EpmB
VVSPSLLLVRTESPAQHHREQGWRRELAEAFREPAELCRFLGLGPELTAEATRSTAGFPFLVPRGFAARMRPGDPADPLLLQVLPRASETEAIPGFSPDPLQEVRFQSGPGLVRKYAGRALLLVTGGCAVNCRYCFRRDFPYAERGASRRGLEAALAEIAADPTLEEVILSGGDPLLADDSLLGEMLVRIADVPQVRRLRIHSRLPVVLPSRIDASLLQLLATNRLARTVVIHANHPAELDAAVAEAVKRLAGLPAIVLNQAVLLRGVNDSVEVLRELSERLVEIGVVPYYLHMLDRVRGASAFEVPEAKASALHRALRESLPGYAVPRLVREVPGARSKTPIL